MTERIASQSAPTSGTSLDLLPPEVRILIHATASSELEKNATPSGLEFSDADWEFVLDLVERNKVVGQMSRLLAKHPDVDIPKKLRSRIRTLHLETSRYSMQLKAELIRVLQALTDANIQTLSFKGPLLGEALYGNLGYRQTSDIDLLCAKEEVLAAKTVMDELGYVLGERLDADDIPTRLADDCELNFVHPESGIEVEVHWDILPQCFGQAASGDYLWDGATQTDVNGVPVLQPSSNGTVQMMFVHNGLKHCWDEFRYVLDVALALRHYADLDLEQILENLNDQGCLRQASVGLLLVERLLDTPLPESAHRATERDTLAAAVAALAMGRMFGRRNAVPSYDAWRTNWRALGFPDARASRATYWRAVLLPEFNDRLERPNLPPVLSPLLYVSRVLRLTRSFRQRGKQGAQAT